MQNKRPVIAALHQGERALRIRIKNRMLTAADPANRAKHAKSADIEEY